MILYIYIYELHILIFAYTDTRSNPASQYQQKGVKMVRPGDVEALLRADPVCKDDLAAALRTTKPSSDGNIIRYIAPTVFFNPNLLNSCALS